VVDAPSSGGRNGPPPPPAPGRTTLSVVDGVAVLVGVVVGIGIFGFAPMVAAGVNSAWMYMALWVAGGLVMLIGALCYAELGTTYPDSGGEYHYLSRAYGYPVGFLFAWARGTVIQTGSIAVVAFIYGEYAQHLIPLGPHGTTWHAIIAVTILTALNIAGTPHSKLLQKIFTATALTALAVVIVGGWLGTSEAAMTAAPAAAPAPSLGVLGLAMVFVLLTYGGWNETAYLAGEMKDVRRDLSRVLFLGTAIVVTLYVFANLAFLNIFGLAGLREADAVGAQLMQRVAGPAGATLLSLLVCCTALSTMNGSILTGSRIYFALGRDVPVLRRLGVWAERGSTPVNALLLQGVIVLGLVLFGALTAGSGASTMVAYTSPVFWLFMFLVGLSVIVFRRRDSARVRPFRLPLYPLPPLLFCLTSAGLMYSSIRYAGLGSLVGLAVLCAGIPFVLFAQRARRSAVGTTVHRPVGWTGQPSPRPRPPA
jgi:basic amino acid/polyamine antiporter, APA family